MARIRQARLKELGEYDAHASEMLKLYELLVAALEAIEGEERKASDVVARLLEMTAPPVNAGERQQR